MQNFCKNIFFNVKKKYLIKKIFKKHDKYFNNKEKLENKMRNNKE